MYILSLYLEFAVTSHFLGHFVARPHTIKLDLITEFVICFALANWWVLTILPVSGDRFNLVVGYVHGVFPRHWDRVGLYKSKSCVRSTCSDACRRWPVVARPQLCSFDLIRNSDDGNLPKRLPHICQCVCVCECDWCFTSLSTIFQTHHKGGCLLHENWQR